MATLPQTQVPQNSFQLIKKLDRELADPAFVSCDFPVPFEVDGLTAQTARIIARAYRASIEFLDHRCVVSRNAS